MPEQRPLSIRIDSETRGDVARDAEQRGISSAQWIREAVVFRLAWTIARCVPGEGHTDYDESLELLREFAAQRKTPRG